MPDVLQTREDCNFRANVQSSGLFSLLGYDTTGMAFPLAACSTSLFPALSDDVAVPFLQRKVRRTKIQTAKLTKLITDIRGSVGLIIRGLDGLGTKINRIRRWLRALRRAIYLYFLINDEEVLPDDGINLIQAQSSIGFRLVCLSSDDLLADPLPAYLQPLVAAWTNKQSTKTAPNMAPLNAPRQA